MTRDEITSELGALIRDVADCVWLFNGCDTNAMIGTRATLRATAKRLAQIQKGVEDQIASRRQAAVPASVQAARNHTADVCVDRIMAVMNGANIPLVKGYGVTGEGER